MKVEIRRLQAGDDALVKYVAEDVFDEPVRPDRLAAYLASPGHLMVVAMADGLVVGQCAAVIHRHPDKASELYIDEVGVTPASSGRASREKCWMPCSHLGGRLAARKPGWGRSQTISRHVRFMNRAPSATGRRRRS